jgi:hypothetical protein
VLRGYKGSTSSKTSHPHVALAKHAPKMPDCQDLSQAHRVVADGLRFNDSVPLMNHDNVIIQKGIIFKTMEAMKIWLAEYAVFHHHPFMVKHSDENKHYALTCRRGCPSWLSLDSSR